ncbi:MAG: thioredoxin family protein [Mongoliibacter sp.]|uniref:thioredoxin family protein n=1 Tax=Mongoliibacter sp. TaxID=2022438 RepID=UPI0012F4682E|nr:thioredoxin family protein [Mongoliibacter sp.]TVP52768.1 MAG: thioredoxin family protein [Mongoliibacter sp.]
MQKLSLFLLGMFFLSMHAMVSAQDSQGFGIGDTAKDFNLKTTDGSSVSLKGLDGAKGAIVIFSCNTCPYVVAYEDRMIALHNKYAPQGYPVIAINSNDAKASPGDSFEKMQERAREKGFTFPYAYDQSQEVIKTYGGTRTPHVYLLQKEGSEFVVKYIGAIDNNYQDASAVTERYVEDAISAMMEGKPVANQTTKAIGCTIKWTKAE